MFVTGASGFVGAKILAKLVATYETTGVYHRRPSPNLIPLDITEEAQVGSVFEKMRPEFVVHSAALIDPDYCEEHPQEAEEINFFGTKYVVNACREIGAKLIYISTMAVFDGKNPPYRETDPVSPVNVYGKTKVAGEEAVQALADHAILRLDQMYGYNGPSQPNGLVGKILAKKKIEANPVNKRNPLLVDDVAMVVAKIIETDGRGIYHLGGPDRMTKYELCKKLEEALETIGDIYSIEAAAQKARRPLDTTPLTERLNALGIVCTSIRSGLKIVREQFRF